MTFLQAQNNINIIFTGFFWNFSYGELKCCLISVDEENVELIF